jgi:thiosulfate dehydrogenase
MCYQLEAVIFIPRVRGIVVPKFFLGLVLGVVIFPAIVALYLLLGFAPAAATAPAMPFERFIAGTALQKRISREAPNRDVSTFTTGDLVAGAEVYKKNCAVCHGGYGQTAPPVAKSMYPEAPQLLTPEGMVTDDPVGVTYWKVSNGIRLSGMPSFAAILDEQQRWQVSALLARANMLPAEARDALKSEASTAPANPAAIPASKKK